MTDLPNTNTARIGRHATLVLVVLALLGSATGPASLSGAMVHAGSDPASRSDVERVIQLSAVPPDGVTDEWRTAALAHIQLDLNADWSDTGQAAGDMFGSSVASAGDVNGDGFGDVLVAAYAYTGAAFRGKVYAYYGSAQGLSAEPDWTAIGENDGDRFGAPVAGAGDVNGDGYADVIIGARDFPGTDKGKVYVFSGSSSGLNTSPAWTATGENDDDYFGTSAASAGDVNSDGYADIIVGAGGFDGARGKVYVFHGSASGPSATADWTATGDTADERFGVSVACAGDVNGNGYSDIIIGANQWKVGIGKAYVFGGSASGLAASYIWDVEGEGTGDYFGSVVAGAGDVNGDGHSDVIIGADSYDDGADANAGRAYVYEGEASGLSSSPTWTTTGENGNDRLGRTVAGIGDANGDGYADVAISAPFNFAGSRRGRVYVHYGHASGLSVAYDTRGLGVSDNDLYGGAVGSAGDVNGDGFADLIIGAPGHDGGTAQGKAYVYHGEAARVSGTIGWFTTGEAEGDQLGYSVAGIGDIDADGYSDVAIGAPAHGSNDHGRVYVYYGARGGFSSFPDWTGTGEGIANRFGSAVAAAGDVNGDGYGDLLVGAEGHPSGSSQGKVYVYYGAEAGLSASPDWSAQGESVLGYFGGSVAGLGDVNKDGYADIVVGAHGHSGSGSVRGKVYGFYGSADGPALTADWSVAGENDGDRFGETVSAAGDVNGDGCADVIVGARGYDNGVLDDAGKTYVFAGSTSGLGVSPYWTSTGMTAGEGLGESVSGAGDVNGDGYADVLVGIPNHNSLQGRVYAYYGGATGVSTSPDWTATGEYPGDYFGASLAGAGDVNGDGYADVLVGAPFHAGGGLEGTVNLFSGSAQGLGAEDAWGKSGENAGDELGHVVSSAGDMNGDGFSDLLIGAHGYLSHTGRAYAYAGSAGPGRQVLVQQTRSDPSRSQVPPWGVSNASNSFYVHLWATDPMGRGRVKMETEICPAGVPFGETACIHRLSSVWKDVTHTASGTRIGSSISGLQPETLYRWRARVLYAPMGVTVDGITAPPHPAHGPWRRLQGQAFEGDIRTAEGSTVFLPFVGRAFSP